jgi:hypothetical protein
MGISNLGNSLSSYKEDTDENISQLKENTDDNFKKVTESIDDVVKNLDSLAKQIFNMVYPVGSIYISVSATNPSTLFGGTWVQIKDTFLLAAGSNYDAGATGGEANHTLTVEEMPSHNHKGQVRVQGYSGWSSYTTSTYEVVHDYQGGDYFGANKTLNAESISGVIIGNKGNSQPHNNMPPYLAVYVWKRVS